MTSASPCPLESAAARVGRGRRRAFVGLAALHAFLLAALVAHGLGTFGNWLEAGFDIWLHNWLILASAAAVLLRAALVPAERRPWLALGVALLGWSAADTYAALAHAGTVPGGYPSFSEVGYAVYYVASATALLLLLHTRRGAMPREAWLDGQAAAFAIGAVASIFMAAPVAAREVEGFGAILTIGYTVADIALVGSAVALAAVSGWRPGRAVALLIAGFGLAAVADGLYLNAAGSSSFAPGTVVDWLWPVATALLAAAAWQPSWKAPGLRVRMSRLPVGAAVFALVALLVVMAEIVHEVGRLPHALGGIAIAMVIARMTLALRANLEILAESRSSAERVREAERRYRMLIERVPAVTYIAELGARGRWRYASPQVGELLGYTPAEFERRPSLWYELVHQDDRAGALADEEAVRLSGGRLVSEYRMVTRDGRTIVVRDEAVRMGEDGTVLGFMLDVTARRQAEHEARRRSEQQAVVARLGRRALESMPLQELLDAAVEGLADALDVEYAAVLELLPGGEELLLRSGVGWREGLVGSARERTGTGSQAGFTLRRGEPVVVEDLREETRFSGSPLLHRHAVVSGLSTVISTKGDVYGVLGAHSAGHEGFTREDVGFLVSVANVLAAAIQRAAAESAMRRAEQRFRVLIDSAPDAILGVDREGRLVLANTRAHHLFGREGDDLLGVHVQELWPESRRSEYLARFSPLWESGCPTGLLIEGVFARLSGGEELPVEATVGSVETDEGRVVLASIRDISQRLREQEEREALRMRLAQAQRLEAVGRLAGGIAHDFNNLLGVILNYAAFLRDQLPDGPARDDVGEIAHAAESATALTSQLLLFSGRRRSETQRVDVNEVVEGARRLLARSLGAQVRLDVSPAAWLPPVEADPGQLEQILINLVVNARDAMAEGGTVTIDTEVVELDAQQAGERPDARAGPHVTLRVRDTGTGMPPEVMGQIFEPFFTTKPKGRGTGLGLASVHGIVAEAGGHLTVVSQEGLGTEIAVHLPAVAELDAAPAPEPGGSVERRGIGETVLLVEDDPAVRAMTQRILEGAGYRVVDAPDGPSALELASSIEGGPDVLLTDLVMPGMQGNELAGLVAEAFPGVRILFASGYSDETLPITGPDDHATRLVAKPFQAHVLLAALRDALESPPGSARTIS